MIGEREIVRDALGRLLAHQGMVACEELPIFGRVADIVYMFNDELVAIEFKLRDWRRALLQATDYKIAADKAYICMPSVPSVSDLIAECETRGVGLLSYSSSTPWPFEVIVEAKKSHDIWQPLKARVVDGLKYRIASQMG